MPDHATTPLEVRCSGCQFRWTVAYLPMPAAKTARLLRRVGCPMCGASSRKIFIATDPAPSPRP